MTRRDTGAGPARRQRAIRPPAVFVWLALTVFWMGVMFDKSAQPYEEQDMRPWLSARIDERHISSLLPHISFTYDGQFVTSAKPYDMAEFFVRKGGHISEYALLAWLWTRTLAAWERARGRASRRMRSVLLAVAIALLYAASDEWHQSFVPGRTGHAVDVLVDACGIALAAALEGVSHRWRRRKQKK
jgi:VanZ family protein